MKLVGFCQLHNEYSKGNLIWWLPMMTSICDYVYIFDQASTDESYRCYRQYTNVVVVNSPTNRFSEELLCKQELIDRVYLDHPDVDWVFWMDGDLLAYCPIDTKSTIRQICEKHNDAVGVRLMHYNLWRSDTHYRTDNNYHWMSTHRVPLWNAKHRIQFDTQPGLHKVQTPIAITDVCVGGDRYEHNTVLDDSCVLLHRGFATDVGIIDKYNTYKAAGQTGQALERILCEHDLETVRLPDRWIGHMFKNDIDPKTLPPIRQIYDQQH